MFCIFCTLTLFNCKRPAIAGGFGFRNKEEFLSCFSGGYVTNMDLLCAPHPKAGELCVVSAASWLALTQQQRLDSESFPQALVTVLFTVGSGQMRLCLMPFFPSPFFSSPIESGGPQLLLAYSLPQPYPT